MPVRGVVKKWWASHTIMKARRLGAEEELLAATASGDAGRTKEAYRYAEAVGVESLDLDTVRTKLERILSQELCINLCVLTAQPWTPRSGSRPPQVSRMVPSFRPGSYRRRRSSLESLCT